MCTPFSSLSCHTLLRWRTQDDKYLIPHEDGPTLGPEAQAQTVSLTVHHIGDSQEFMLRFGEHGDFLNVNTHGHFGVAALAEDASIFEFHAIADDTEVGEGIAGEKVKAESVGREFFDWGILFYPKQKKYFHRHTSNHAHPWVLKESPSGAEIWSIDGAKDTSKAYPHAIRLVKSVVHFGNPPDKEPIVTEHSIDDLHEKFVIAEGTIQTETLYFIVYRDVHNLTKTEITKKMGVTLSTNTHVLGDFTARGEPYQFTFPQNKVPSGFFVRGSYGNKIIWKSDEGEAYPEMNSTFDIVKA